MALAKIIIPWVVIFSNFREAHVLVAVEGENDLKCEKC